MRRRNFYLNSRNRTSGADDSDCYIEVQIPPHETYTHVCVLEMNIPKSYYLVQAGYNTFTMLEDGVSRTITITPACYTATTFRIEVTARLNTGAPAGWVYTMAYPTGTSPQTGKWTFTVTGNAGSQPSIVTTTNVYEQLGFRQNTTNTFVADSLTSTNVMKMQSEDSLYLHSDIISGVGDDILQEIYTSGVADFGVITYRCQSWETMSKQLTRARSTSFRFTLTNEDNRVMVLNGLNWNMTLMVYALPEPPTLPPLKPDPTPDTTTG